MINILLNMSLSGSIVVILWFIVFFVSKSKLNVMWHYNVMKIGLFFMLFPIGKFVSTLNSHAKFLTPTVIDTYGKSAIFSIDIKFSITTFHYLAIFWAIGAVALLAHKIYVYYKLKHYILSKNADNVNTEITNVFLSCKKYIDVKMKVIVKTNSLVSTPLVIGLLRPTIIIPDSNMQADQLRFVFLHELSHIKNKDLWFRLFSLVALILHWYNPFVHLLNKQIKDYSEMCCDASVVQLITPSERRQYGMLILEQISDMATMRYDLCTPLAATQNIKRRLFLMYNFKIMKLSNKILSGVLAVSIIACTVVTTAHASNTIISHDEKWIMPFESIITTVYDLGDGFTAKSTTTTVTNITSVKHTDKGEFTTEQWNEILAGIADGSIVWED